MELQLYYIFKGKFHLNVKMMVYRETFSRKISIILNILIT